MARILLDTGVIVALFDADDKYHLQAVKFIKNNRHELLITLANITEALYLIDNVATQANLLNWIGLAKITLVNIGADDLAEIGKLMVQYANVPMDFADGCLLHIANVQKIEKIATIDSDFYIYKIQGKYPFKLVLEN